LAGFDKQRKEFEADGANVVAASVDPLDKAKEVAAELSYPIGYGVTREQADRIGAWWESAAASSSPRSSSSGATAK
jgi:peroxiredoxin